MPQKLSRKHENRKQGASLEANDWNARQANPCLLWSRRRNAMESSHSKYCIIKEIYSINIEKARKVITMHPKEGEERSVAVDHNGSTPRLRQSLQALRSYPHPLERTTSKLRLLSPEPSRVRLVNNEVTPLRKSPTDRQPQRTDSQCFGNEDPSGL